MANDLLADFRAASNRFDHVLYNEQTQRFERAGKRHAIAAFFGSAAAISKNEATIAKIKEAVGMELKEDWRFGGSGVTAERLFSGIDVGRRIKSGAVRSIIDEFRRNAIADADALQRRKETAVAKMCDMISENLSVSSSLLSDARCKDVLKAVAMHHLDAALCGMDAKSSISLLESWCDGAAGWKNGGQVSGAFADFAGFVVGVNTDPRLQNAFETLLGRVAREDSPRFAQMVCLEMQSAAGPLCRNLQDAGQSDWTDAAAERIGRLLADMDDATSDFSILKNMDMLPLDRESYSVALDVCAAVKGTPELAKWLVRQPQDARVGLAAAILDAMGRFGDSDDPVLLRKLMGAGDGIARLYARDELTLESAYRTMEGRDARLPEVLNVDGRSVGKASDEVRYFFRDRAIGEFCGLFPNGPGVADTVVGTRLIVSLGCSPAVAYWIAGSCPNVDLARLSDEQLRMFTAMTGSEMEILNRIAGFETALGTDADGLYVQISDPGSSLRRLMSYPELSSDATVYMKSRDLLNVFDARVGELASGGVLCNIKETTKWMLERFVFQDLAMHVANGGTFPDVKTFADGLAADNQFVRILEGSVRRPHVAWTMLGIEPKYRTAVLSAMDAYGVYDNLYLVTRLISNKDKVSDLYDRATESGTALDKKDVFGIVMGEEAKFDPRVQGSSRFWDDVVDEDSEWVLSQRGLSFEDGALYSRKHSLVADFLQKYDLPKAAVADLAFQESRDGEITFRHSKYTEEKVAIVVSSLEKGIADAAHQFDIDYDRVVPGRYEVKFNFSGGAACFRRTDAAGNSFQCQKDKEGIRESVIGICGASHPKQAENLLMVLSQAFELDLYAPFIAFGFNPADRESGVSRNFEISRNGRDGSVSVHVTDLGVSAVKYDWSITLFADGTHRATDMKAWRNPDCDGARL